MNRNSLKQIAAAILSISFLWTLAACALFCSDFFCEEYSNDTAFSVSYNHSDADDCQITESAKAATTDRIIVHTFALILANYRENFVPKYKVKSVKIDLSRNVRVFAGPLLEMLRVLRI